MYLAGVIEGLKGNLEGVVKEKGVLIEELELVKGSLCNLEK